MGGGHRPGEQAADVGADDHRVGLAERRDQRGDVGGQVRRVVAARRFVARAVAAQVDGDGVVAGVGQVDQLLVPGPPELREAVQQQHERTGAGLGDVQRDAVGLDGAVRPRAVDQDDRAVRGARERTESHGVVTELTWDAT